MESIGWWEGWIVGEDLVDLWRRGRRNEVSLRKKMEPKGSTGWRTNVRREFAEEVSEGCMIPGGR